MLGARVRLLCLDTATDALSCALSVDGELFEHHEVAPRRHAERVLAVVDRVLAEAGTARGQLDAIAFGQGPGSFTGLRIGAGVAQGLGFALDVPVIPVSTLAALAQGALREGGARQVLAVLDARLGEVYASAQRAQAGLMQPIRRERLCRPEDLADELADDAGGGWVGCGPGWHACPEALRGRLEDRLERVEPDRLPRARDVAVLARAAWEEGLMVSAEEAFPVYLRRQVVSGPPGADGKS